MIETQVGHDPVNPGVERTFEPETADVFVGFEEGVLVDVLRVLLGPGEMESEAQHRLVVMTNEFLEGGAVPALGLSDQHRVVYAAFLPSHAAPRGVLVLADSFHSLALRFRAGPIANRKWYCPNTCRHVSSCPLFARYLPYPGLHRNRRIVSGTVSRNYRVGEDYLGQLGDSGAKI